MYGFAPYGTAPYGATLSQTGTTPTPGDTTAPTLTAASATATGSTTATGSVTTSEAGGALYFLASASSTATAAQVQAGASKAVTAAGAQTVAFTGLPAAAVLYPHYVHVDAAGNVSAVANGASFTTSAAADTTAPTLSAPNATSTGATTASGSVTTNEGNGTLYFMASVNATESSATVKAGATQAISSTGAKNVALTGLMASTLYYLHFLHRDAAGNDSAVANTASFTTAAAADTTGPVMQGAISFTKTATSINLTWAAALDASSVEYFVSKDGNAAASTGATLGANFTGLAPSSSHQFVVTARDSSNNPSSNSLSVTVTTSDAGTTYATYIEETFIDDDGNARANLTSMHCFVWAETGSTPLGAPIGQTNTATTDANGLLHVDFAGQTAVMPGAPVRICLTNDNGDPAQAGLFSYFGTVLAH